MLYNWMVQCVLIRGKETRTHSLQSVCLWRFCSSSKRGNHVECCLYYIISALILRLELCDFKCVWNLVVARGCASAVFALFLFMSDSWQWTRIMIPLRFGILCSLWAQWESSLVGGKTKGKLADILSCCCVQWGLCGIIRIHFLSDEKAWIKSNLNIIFSKAFYFDAHQRRHRGN